MLAIQWDLMCVHCDKINQPSPTASSISSTSSAFFNVLSSYCKVASIYCKHKRDCCPSTESETSDKVLHNNVVRSYLSFLAGIQDLGLSSQQTLSLIIIKGSRIKIIWLLRKTFGAQVLITLAMHTDTSGYSNYPDMSNFRRGTVTLPNLCLTSSGYLLKIHIIVLYAANKFGYSIKYWMFY